VAISSDVTKLVAREILINEILIGFRLKSTVEFACLNLTTLLQYVTSRILLSEYKNFYDVFSHILSDVSNGPKNLLQQWSDTLIVHQLEYSRTT